MRSVRSSNMSTLSNSELLALVAEEAIEAYCNQRRLATPRYFAGSAVRAMKVWRILAGILVRGDITAEDWMAAQFEACPGGAPFVQGLASDTSRKNFEHWKKSHAGLQDPCSIRIEDDIRRARTLATNLGLKVLDGFFLDSLSPFLAITRCAFCSDQVLDSVASKFGETCRLEIEQDPTLLNHVSLHENRIQALRGYGAIPVSTT